MPTPSGQETQDLIAELDAEFGKKKNERGASDTFSWEQHPDAEVVRLTNLLRQHLSRHGVPARERTYARARELLLRTLEEQKGTCFFAGGDDRYCWITRRMAN